MDAVYDFWCKEELSSLRYYERRIAEIPDEIAEERARITAIKSSTTGSTPVQGGGNKREEWLVSALDHIDQLEADLKYFSGKVKLTYQALDVLDPEDKHILIVLYVDKIKYGARKIAADLFIEEATVWRRRTAALNDYCRARHGGTEC